MEDIRDIQQLNFLSYYGNGTVTAENNANGQAAYIGYAEPGTAKSSPKWQIRKITYDANGAMTDVQFANGTNKFDKVWNDRATYSYS